MVALPLTRVPFSCPAQFVKCGFAGDNIPKHVFPSMIGRPMLRAEEGVIGEGDNLSVRFGAGGVSPRVPPSRGPVCALLCSTHVCVCVFNPVSRGGGVDRT